MPVSPTRARELALSLENASEAPHFDRIAFRTPRKIFATLASDGSDLNLMLDLDLQELFRDRAPHAISPVSGGWGRMGATRCVLDAIDESTLQSALEAAHSVAAPRRPRKKSTG